MSLIGALDKTKHFEEFDEYLPTQDALGATAGVLTPGERKQTALQNLLGSDELDLTFSSSSTAGATSVEPVSFTTTMTGVGGVGGRWKFAGTTAVALGAWSNALKAEWTYSSGGKTTGLGSAFVAEMTLEDGCDSGTYAPHEIELNMPTGALTGTATSFIYASVNGAAASTFDDNGFLINLAGVTAGASKLYTTGNTQAGDISGTLKIKVLGTVHYLNLYDAPATTT